jgi:hypothetical protein
VNVTDMITHVFLPQKAVESVQLTTRHRDGSLKVIIHPHEYPFRNAAPEVLQKAFLEQATRAGQSKSGMKSLPVPSG